MFKMKAKTVKAETNEVTPIKVVIHDLGAWRFCLSVYDFETKNRGKMVRTSGIAVKLYETAANGEDMKKRKMDIKTLAALASDLDNDNRLMLLNLMTCAYVDVQSMVNEYISDIPRGDKAGDAIEALNDAARECAETYAQLLEEVRNPPKKTKKRAAIGGIA